MSTIKKRKHETSSDNEVKNVNHEVGTDKAAKMNLKPIVGLDVDTNADTASKIDSAEIQNGLEKEFNWPTLFDNLDPSSLFAAFMQRNWNSFATQLEKFYRETYLPSLSVQKQTMIESALKYRIENKATDSGEFARIYEAALHKVVIKTYTQETLNFLFVFGDKTQHVKLATELLNINVEHERVFDTLYDLYAQNSFKITELNSDETNICLLLAYMYSNQIGRQFKNGKNLGKKMLNFLIASLKETHSTTSIYNSLGCTVSDDLLENSEPLIRFFYEYYAEANQHAPSYFVLYEHHIKNPEKAWTYLNQAASLGHKDAHRELAMTYLQDHPVFKHKPYNIGLALEHIQSCATLKTSAGRRMKTIIALATYYGIGEIKKNEQLALNMLKKNTRFLGHEFIYTEIFLYLWIKTMSNPDDIRRIFHPYFNSGHPLMSLEFIKRLTPFLTKEDNVHEYYEVCINLLKQKELNKHTYQHRAETYFVLYHLELKLSEIGAKATLTNNPFSFVRQSAADGFIPAIQFMIDYYKSKLNADKQALEYLREWETNLVMAQSYESKKYKTEADKYEDLLMLSSLLYFD